MFVDIFTADAFSFISLKAAVEKVPFQPFGLGALNIFEPKPIMTTALEVEERNGILTLIPFSDRGAPGKERVTEKRKARFFKVPRLYHKDTLYASSLQNIRAFGEEQQVMTAAEEVARRMSGPTGLKANMEYTKEYHRLACIQGQLLDSDGTIMYDYFKEFGITRPSAIAFSLGSGTLNSIRPLCNQVIRAMARAGQGAFIPGRTKVFALCGDQFYDNFVNHPDVLQYFRNYQAGAESIINNGQGAAFETFYFGGIYWINYRGSDDASTVAIGTNQAKFFPVDAPGVFMEARAPGESFASVNTLGEEYYPLIVPDMERDEFVHIELKAYPLHICTRPEMLQQATG